MHHNLNGVHILYSTNKNPYARWQWNAGLRIALNTFVWQRNRQNHIEYQTGYAMNFGEHFGLYANGSTKIISIKQKFRVEGIMCATLSRNSKLYHIYDYEYGTYNIIEHDIYKAQPYTYFELGLGLKFSYQFSPRAQVYATSLLGIFIGPKIEKGVGILSTAPYTMFSHHLNKVGSWEMVGIEGVPIMSIGLRYQLKK